MATARLAYLLFFFALLLNMSSSTGTSAQEAAFAAPTQPQQRSGVNNEDQTQSGPPESTANEIPRLPESSPDSNLPRIKLGETISFERLGPVIINTDGTTRVIENWNELSSNEQAVTWRRISKRNEERRKILLEKQEADAASANEEL